MVTSSRTRAADEVRAAIAAGLRAFDDRAVSAEHEAAHAVTYLALGMPLYRVEIEPSPITMSTRKPELWRVSRMAVAHIAGVVVEDSYRSQPLAERVADAVEWVESNDPDDYWDMGIFGHFPELAERSYAEAVNILTRHSDAHAAIADALYERGTLTGREVAALPEVAAMLATLFPTKTTDNTERNDK